MLGNYIAAALRNLVRNKLYAVINILGLTVGFASALLIALFVREELTYDRWIPGSENIYRVGKTAHPPNAQTLKTDGSGLAEAAWLKQDIPEIQHAVRLAPRSSGVRQGDIEGNETVVWADSDVFQVFPFPVLAGSLSTALDGPDSLVITRAVARKYFGRDDVVGETLLFDQKSPMRVAAVIADLPVRTHLDFNIIASARSSSSPMAATYKDEPGFAGAYTYIRIAPGTATAVQAQLANVINNHVSMTVYTSGPTPIAKPGTQASALYSYNLQPIAAIHMMAQNMQFEAGGLKLFKPSGDRSMVTALSVTAVFILMVAVANFTNLMTARAGRRAVEVGVRKSSGAQRHDVVMQFMGESFVYVLTALVLAVAIVMAGLPAFGAVLGRDIPFGALTEPVAMFLFGGALVVAGVLGGLYPAFVLSAFNPAGALHEAKAGGKLFDLRRILVIAQFAILIGLMIATAIIARQTAFAIQEGLKLDSDQLVFVESDCGDAFKNQVAALPGVADAACATRTWLGGTSAVSLNTLADGRRVNVYQVGVGAGLFELLGVKILAGRAFQESDMAVTPETINERRSILINETAMRLYGYTSAEAAVGQGAGRTVIIGVVQDFTTDSVRAAVAPTVFYLVKSFSYLAVKLRGESVGESLRAIDRAWKDTGAPRPIARQFYNQHVQDLYVDIVRQTRALSAFSAIAIMIACLGLFGLSAFTAEQRTKEIGIRKAMGANPRDMLRLLVWQFTRPVLYANIIAWPAAYMAMKHWLDGFAYHIDLEPWTFLGASALALAIAVCTVAGHAWLVARTQPVKALRYE